MRNKPAYTETQHLRAVNLSALLGWASVAVPLALFQPRPLDALALLLVGLPVAFLLCWFIGSPFLSRLMRHGISWTKSALWGAALGMLLSLFPVLIMLFLGWRQSHDPTTYSRMGSVEHPTSIDGILTAYGWLLLARDFGIYAVRGAFVGLAIRWIIGPGAPDLPDPPSS